MGHEIRGVTAPQGNSISQETQVGEIFEEPMKIAGLWRSRDTLFWLVEEP